MKYENLWLTAPSYTVGQVKIDLTEDELLGEKLMNLGLPKNPEMLGIRFLRQSSNIYELAKFSIEQTLKLGGVNPNSVDCILLSSNDFEDKSVVRNKNFSKVVTDLGINPDVYLAITGTGCTSMLSALELGCGRLVSGQSKNVLVVNIDKLGEPPENRLLNFAVISDSSSSFLLSNEKISESSLRILSGLSLSDASQTDRGITLGENKIGVSVKDEALELSNTSIGQIKALLSNNVFLPVKKIIESSLGFKSEQLFLGNVEEYGHCAANDICINLVDYLGYCSSGKVMLYSAAEGHAAAWILDQEGAIA